MTSPSTAAVIVSYARTPVTKFCGSLSSLTAPQLGTTAIRGALSRLNGTDITIPEAYMGNVVSAGVGQAPCRQAVIGAGLPPNTICTTINKVCASGMKSVTLASQTIQLGGSTALLAGGMESMSNIPHYLPSSRTGTTLGHAKILDGVIHDGLWDVYNDQHMGMCAEKCASDYAISREDQDAYAIESYRRAQEAIEKKVFEDEIEGVEVPQRRGDSKIVSTDEEPFSVKLEKVSALKPAFQRENGTVTAANASSLNDGAAAMVLMSEQAALDMGLKPLARIRGFGDAEQDPVDFTTTPSLAVPVALKNAGMKLSDVDYHEVNEAFSVVAIANMKLLNLDPSKVNVFGGAVSIGHPIGMSGARIIGTLYNVLKQCDATIGCASICNGGGGASAIVIERMN
uniref:Acetyl-CoA acetyltransferase n=2 Tax=Helicotheca tamesis TaxID=374047 RepID=A0A7S2HN88_9STRA|eukprot:CAMPEP_0185732392 /NCGR_PEP_ID=MMETSP1171-20130828/16000_1 /TAXON_ID=374046 /ORGANISM="Helicotheca tamensis, Strain CCMP826" /LENGTH=398 /DNA_ID=CAMNT_0028401865 /DNA_START=17 /DNA_END=1213 /DNA_ORIENTATION=+